VLKSGHVCNRFYPFLLSHSCQSHFRRKCYRCIATPDQARRAGRRSHTAGSGGLRQASRSFISSNSSRSHPRTASMRSTSVGAAVRLFDCHAISATSLRLSIGSPCFKLTAVQRARTDLTVPCLLGPRTKPPPNSSPARATRGAGRFRWRHDARSNQHQAGSSLNAKPITPSTTRTAPAIISQRPSLRAWGVSSASALPISRQWSDDMQ